MTIAYKCNKCNNLVEDAVATETIHLLNHKVYIWYSNRSNESSQEDHFCGKCRVELLKEVIENLEEKQEMKQ